VCITDNQPDTKSNPNPNLTLTPGAEWAVWQPCIYRVGRLVRRPGGSPRRMWKLASRHRPTPL